MLVSTSPIDINRSSIAARNSCKLWVYAQLSKQAFQPETNRRRLLLPTADIPHCSSVGGTEDRRPYPSKCPLNKELRRTSYDGRRTHIMPAKSFRIYRRLLASAPRATQEVRLGKDICKR